MAKSLSSFFQVFFNAGVAEGDGNGAGLREVEFGYHIKGDDVLDVAFAGGLVDGVLTDGLELIFFKAIAKGFVNQALEHLVIKAGAQTLLNHAAGWLFPGAEALEANLTGVAVEQLIAACRNFGSRDGDGELFAQGAYIADGGLHDEQYLFGGG